MANTSQVVLKELHAKLSAEYTAELVRLPLNKATREVLLYGFRDGVASAFTRLRSSGILTTEEGQ